MGKEYNFKHTQHTAKFINELNSVTSIKPFTPFRISDEVWLVGKYKGKKISEIPESYIRWAINNMNLTSTAKSILNNKII